MKVKSKMATDIKSLVLAKAKIYARNKPDSVADEDDSEDETKNEPKVSEAEKEKKREKMRLKKQKKREARTKSLQKNTDEAKNAAVNYLHEWNSSRESWCFKKKLQYWLLKNVFDSDSISDSDFEILLNYIIDLKGVAKSRLIEECEKVVKLQEEKLEKSASDEDVANTTFERARSLLQILF